MKVPETAAVLLPLVRCQGHTLGSEKFVKQEDLRGSELSEGLAEDGVGVELLEEGAGRETRETGRNI